MRWLLVPALFVAALLAPRSAVSDELALKITGPDGAPVASAVVAAAPGPPGRGFARMNQVDLQFQPPLLIAVAGQRLRIGNSDSRVHHVRCHDHELNFNVLLRPGERHELALKTSRSVTLLCNIHAAMRAKILVVDSTAYGVSDDQGRLVLKDFPAEARKIKVWTRFDGYQRPHLTLLDKAKRPRTITLPAAMTRAPEKPPRQQPERRLTPGQQSRRLLDQLARALELREAGGPKEAAALGRDARSQIFIAGGVRFWLRKRFGRKGAFAVEQRLVVLEAMLADETRDRTPAAKTIIDELERFFAPLIKGGER